jgi:hypothetical protein
MNRSILILALVAALGLSACERQPTVAALPAPAAEPGPAGPQGETGQTGATTVVRPPAVEFELSRLKDRHPRRPLLG